MDIRKIQWAKILVEWHINQIIIDIEKEAVVIILRRLAVCYPIQLIPNDFDGLSMRCRHLRFTDFALYWSGKLLRRRCVVLIRRLTIIHDMVVITRTSLIIIFFG